jgi:hypothetical protein
MARSHAARDSLFDGLRQGVEGPPGQTSRGNGDRALPGERGLEFQGKETLAIATESLKAGG